MEPNVATAAKPVKIPGPDHPITIERNPARVIVSIAGRVVADTREALTLREAAYPAVQYIPRKDVDMALLDRTDHTTYCPYKGNCSYFSIPLGGERSVHAVSLPTPPSRRSKIISPFTLIASTRSKNGQRSKPFFPLSFPGYRCQPATPGNSQCQVVRVSARPGACARHRLEPALERIAAMRDLSGKTSLVTGASRGIGRASPFALARAGAQLVAHYGRGRRLRR